MENENSKAALLMARVAMLNARIAGMVAENMVRESLGQSMAYQENAFCKVADESGCGENAAIALLYDR